MPCSTVCTKPTAVQRDEFDLTDQLDLPYLITVTLIHIKVTVFFFGIVELSVYKHAFLKDSAVLYQGIQSQDKNKLCYHSARWYGVGVAHRLAGTMAQSAGWGPFPVWIASSSPRFNAKLGTESKQSAY